MIRKYKKNQMVLNYIEPLLILAFTITDCVSISAFVLLVSIPIASSGVGLKISLVTAEN